MCVVYLGRINLAHVSLSSTFLLGLTYFQLLLQFWGWVKGRPVPFQRSFVCTWLGKAVSFCGSVKSSNSFSTPLGTPPASICQLMILFLKLFRIQVAKRHANFKAPSETQMSIMISSETYKLFLKSFKFPKSIYIFPYLFFFFLLISNSILLWSEDIVCYRFFGYFQRPALWPYFVNTPHVCEKNCGVQSSMYVD